MSATALQARRIGPATRVTLLRAALAAGVAALAVESLVHDTPVALLVTLAAVALVLDLVDGWIARHTGTETALGARLDGEVDAFLILALSVYVAPVYGTWVLAIGAARYVFLAGEWLVPWMRAALPRRRWRLVVAAAQGVVLTIAASEILPRTPTQVLLAVALAALTVSVGECVWWLWRRRDGARDAVAFTVLALLLVWVGLVAPSEPKHLELAAFARIPLELLVVVAAAVLLPAAPRRILAVAVGAVLSALLLVKVLDMGFFTAFNRPFDPVSDWSYAGIGAETLRDAVGNSSANLAIAGVVLLAAALLVLPALALLRVTRVAARRRRWALHAVAAVGVVWLVLRVFGAPVASTSATALAVDQVQAVRAGLQAREVLAGAIARDPFKATPGDRLLTGLRGKDVLLVFVESYGRVAVQDSSVAPGVNAVLDRGTVELQDAGFSARSGFLESSTFGGLSWLAHSTLQSGVRIGTQRGYGQLVHSNRFTLTRAFKRAGWRVVAAMPANKRAWPEGSTFYGFDEIYDRRNLGYRGPAFGLPSMPDQYVFEALHRMELARHDRPRVFAELDLLSSHAPWTKVPQLIPWEDVGDGSVFEHLPADEFSELDPVAYGASIEYTLSTVVSYVQRYGDDDLVLVVLGDHQPATVITGQGAGHDVPISVIARDPKVLDRIAGWGWQGGMRPDPDAPVWPMEAFRDRFLTAFG